MEVRILGISGSPRHGNTELLVKEALEAAKALGEVQTELISLADFELKPCDSCHLCFGNVKGATEDEICLKHKDVDPIIKRMFHADGLIIGSPVYTWNVSARLKCLMEKCAAMCPYVAAKVSYKFRNKVVGAISVAGTTMDAQVSVSEDIWRWAIALGMIPVGAILTMHEPKRSSSLLGGLATTAHSRSPLDPDAIIAAKTLTTPPLMGERQMMSARNLGRNVTTVSKIIKAGLKALEERGVKIPEACLNPYKAK
jgi:multimeric flavodoxin WrbA